MSIVSHIKDYLDHYKINYVAIDHGKAYKAHELAKVIEVPERKFAKSVVIKIDGKAVLAVLPASHHIDFGKLKDVLDTDTIEMVNEREIEDYFPSCELGAMPPLGNLFDLPVYVSRDLRGEDEIVFNAGTHTDAIRMRYKDFEQLTEPIVCDFSKLAIAA